MTIGTLSPTEKDLYKIVALVRQLAEGTAPVFQNQYNLERGRQLDAITGMYGAGNTTGGLLSSLDRARLANMQAGIGAADAALNAQMWGPTQMLAVEAQRRGIPLQALAAQYGMVLPAAQAFGTQTGSGTSAGASSGQSASSSAGTSTSRSVGSDTSQTTQSTPFNPLSLLPYAFTAMPADDHARARVPGLLDVLLDDLELRWERHRPHVDRARTVGWALAECLGLLRHLGHKLVVDRSLHVDALDRDARLAAVLHRVVDRVLAARSRSASARTIMGSLPPSSSETGVRVWAARSMTFRPVRVEPVNITMSTWSIRTAPVSPVPTATWKTPSGRPHSCSPRSNKRDVSGVTSDGLTTTVFPAASAGMASPTLLTSG